MTLQDKIIEELRQAKLANRTAARVVPLSQTRFSLGKTESICEKTIEYVSILFNVSTGLHISNRHFRFPENSSSLYFEEATKHILHSHVDAFIAAIKADTKL